MIFGSQSEDIDEGGENENAGPDVSWMERQLSSPARSPGGGMETEPRVSTSPPSQRPS